MEAGGSPKVQCRSARLATSFIPFIGDANDLFAIATGYDIIWNERVSRAERGLYAAGLLFGSGGAYRHGLGLSDDALEIAKRAEGFKSHRAFTRAMGKAGYGREWHHLVTQQPKNVAQFGPEVLHNTYNTIPVPYALHVEVNRYYNSIDRSVHPTMRVYQWLATQPYHVQR